MEDRKGRIREGYYADMVLLDRDIFTVDPMEIKEIKPVMTMVGGKDRIHKINLFAAASDYSLSGSSFFYYNIKTTEVVFMKENTIIINGKLMTMDEKGRPTGWSSKETVS